MKEIMTRERIRKEAKDRGLEEEVDRILTLAERVLQLKPDERHSVTVGFQLRVARGYKTVFRIGPDYERTGRPGITFPFHSWPVPENRVLETLRADLLANVPRLDKGGAHYSVRLEISRSSIDDLIVAICAIYGELRREFAPRAR